MIEKTIYLEGVDPKLFYGVRNTSFEVLKNAFPKIKITGRGNELFVVGDKIGIENFEQKIVLIIEYFHKYNSLSTKEIGQIIYNNSDIENKLNDNDVIIFGNNGKAIKAKTPNQISLISEFDKNDLLFAVGPAGTGKTYTAIALAARALRNKEVKKIILTRPAVEAGEKLGFLPGDMKEKLDPYLQPLYDALHDMIPISKLNTMMEEGIIQIAPLAFMRGRTLDNAFVILDEAQNATNNQLKMFLTRMGANAKFIVTGDVTQIDLPDKRQSGLLKALEILKNIDGISIVEFNQSDIIRHKLVKNIVNAYELNQ